MPPDGDVTKGMRTIYRRIAQEDYPASAQVARKCRLAGQAALSWDWHWRRPRTAANGDQVQSLVGSLSVEDGYHRLVRDEDLPSAAGQTRLMLRRDAFAITTTGQRYRSVGRFACSRTACSSSSRSLARARRPTPRQQYGWAKSLLLTSLHLRNPGRPVVPSLTDDGPTPPKDHVRLPDGSRTMATPEPNRGRMRQLPP